MITENSSNFDDFEKDLEELLCEHEQSRAAAVDRERELNMYRSGSAPPTVEGSRAALRSLMGPANDDELRAHPDYLSYYYSNDNLNPRMPPPLGSKEEWRVAQRFRTAKSVIGDRRRKGVAEADGGGSESSLFPMQLGLTREDEEGRGMKEKALGNGGLIGLADVGLGARRKSFTDAIQVEKLTF